ncbi:MAG: glycosyltransferase family 39 protein [Aquabacterium sp.]|nr:glycosyltransferase family 39 protein [Aquabacterium sp.]
MTAHAGASLHIDEAQYWDWSTQLQWGYYSKPPVIAALIAWSTAWFGDSEVGLRAIPMLSYPLTALVLGAWLADAARDTAVAASAAVWACALYLASPIAGVLGVVATTDGPLLLCWAVALAALWWAVVRRQPAAWVVLALAGGAGLMSKYSFAAFGVGAVGWVLTRSDRRGLPALALAMLAALLLWSPNLAWNHTADWPTWRHTADITVAAARHGADLGERAAALGTFILGQGLMLAPLLLLLLPRLQWLRHQNTPTAVPAGWTSLLLWTSLPLAGLGMVQAWRGGAQVNWIAPVHLAACAALAWWLATACARAQRLAAAALLVQLACVSLLVAGPALAARSGRSWPADLDLWARMRGWPEAMAALQPVLQAHPQALLVGTSRQVMAQTGYHARRLGLQRAGWQDDSLGPAQHHYTLHCRWRPVRGGARSVLILSDGPPPALGDGLQVQTLAQATVRDLRGTRHTLWLSQLSAPFGAAPDQAVC